MSENSSAFSRRRSSRYGIIDLEATQVTIIVAGEGDDQRHEGILADLSSNGVRVALGVCLEKDAPVQFHLSVPSVGLEFSCLAHPRWFQPRDAESWWVGCELTEVISDEMIDALARGGLLDRRRDPRYPVSYPAVVKWELGDKPLDVELVNYSKGGICILSQEGSGLLSERVMLQVASHNRDATIPCRVMWQRKTEAGFVAGCSFTGAEDFIKLREIVAPVQNAQKVGATQPRETRKLHFFVLILVFLLLAVKGIELLVPVRLAPQSESSKAMDGSSLSQLHESVEQAETRRDPT